MSWVLLGPIGDLLDASRGDRGDSWDLVSVFSEPLGLLLESSGELLEGH